MSTHTSNPNPKPNPNPSPSYPKVISTRTYDDRLQTIANVRKAGISVCCGGILGLGTSETDHHLTLPSPHSHPQPQPNPKPQPEPEPQP